MATRTITIASSLDELWPVLQRLETWEGLGGMRELGDATWDPDGDLASFAFAIDTPLGLIRDRADVTANRPSLQAVADSKGIAVDVALDLAPGDHEDSTTVSFSIDGRSTSFLTRALVGTLRSTLDNGIDGEAETLHARLSEALT